MLGNILNIIKERYTLEKIDAKEFSSFEAYYDKGL